MATTNVAGPPTRAWLRPDRHLLPLAAAAATTLLGLSRVNDQPFWYDEAATARVVDRGLDGFVDVITTQEAGQGPYYVGLWIWTRVSHDDAWIRLFSVAGAAIAAAAIVRYAVGRFGWWVGAATALLLVTHPFFLRYLTEARGYSWMMVTGVAVVVLHDRLARSPTQRTALGLGATAGIGLALNPLFVLLIAATFVFPVDRAEGFWRACGTVLTAAAAIFACFVPAMLARPDQIDWIRPVTVEEFRTVTLEFLGGSILAWVVLIGILAALTLAVRRSGNLTLGRSLLIAIGYPVGVLLFSAVVRPLWLARYMAPAFPFLVLGASAGLIALTEIVSSRPVVKIALACGLAGVGIAASNPLVDQTRGATGRETIDYLLMKASDDTVIITNAPVTEVLHFLGYRPDLDVAALPDDDHELDPLRRDWSEIANEVADAERVELVYYTAWPASDDVFAFVESRDVQHIETFGMYEVWTLVPRS